MTLENTKTEANLKASFAGESQARNKYTYFASQARKDGYEQMAGIFEETANHEKEHAKSALKFLDGIGDTEANLKTKRWMCRNCGYVHEGKQAPLACPACRHPQAFFEVKAESY